MDFCVTCSTDVDFATGMQLHATFTELCRNSVLVSQLLIALQATLGQGSQ